MSSPVPSSSLDAEKQAFPAQTHGEDSLSAEGDREKPQGEPNAPKYLTGITRIIVVITIYSSTFLFALDNTLVADIQPAIIDTFHDISKLSWLTVAFPLGAASTVLVWGRLYGNFDGKWLYLLTTLIFEAGSALCGGAPNMDALIVGRAICGLGGAGMYLGVLTLLSSLIAPPDRPLFIGLMGMTWGLGTVLGPIVGGAFAVSSATWRWGFYINLCIGGFFAPVYFFMIPRSDPRPGTSFRKRFVEIDWVGGILMIGVMTTIIMAIAFGGVVYAWNSGRIIALFVLSGVLCIALCSQQTFSLATTEERRIFPVAFLRQKEMVILFVETLAAATSCFVPIYFIPLFFQFVHTDTALEAGVRLLPFICFMVFGTVLNGFAMGQYGYYMPWYVAGSTLALIGGALLYKVDEFTSTGAVYGYLILTGFGTGIYSQASFTVAQALVEPRLIPLAIGFITCAQISGATVALSVADTVFLNRAQTGLESILPNVPLADIQGIITGVGSSVFASLDEDTRAKALHIIVESMANGYVLILATASLALILSVFLSRAKLDLEGAVAAVG
ncbi:hypothetical protein MMC25_005056 [Agyrium rufum]|nr:hypothetical protein [Agyrium rufum]